MAVWIPLVKWLITNADKVVLLVSGLASAFSDSNQKQKEDSKAAAKEVAKAPSVDVEKASIDEIQRVNRILSEYKNSAALNANNMESNLLNLYTQHINGLIDSLKSVIDTDKLERLSNRAKGQIKGKIANVIMPKISIDNVECANILKITENNYRAECMRNFMNSVYADALNDTKEILVQNLNDSISDIKDMLKDKMQNEEAKIRESLAFLQDFKTSHDIESKQAKEIAQSYRIFVDSNSVNFLSTNKI